MKAQHLLLAVALAAGCAPPAFAEDGPSQAAPDRPDVSSVDAAPFAARPVGEDRLNAITGQADILEVINAQNRATVTDNRVSGNSVTGAISFDSSAFADMNGLALISANSGNNVAINASLNVNVAIRP